MIEVTNFEYDLSQLSKNERDVILKLQKVGEIVHKIWLKQYDPSTKIIKVYPLDISKEELVKANVTNPKILSPFTVVKRGKDRKLYTVDFHEEYSREYNNIGQLLDQVCELTEDKDLKKYLSEIKKNFLKGNYEKMMEIFLRFKNTKIDILIGPIESYNDNLMDVKRTFQYSLRVMREDETDGVNKMSDIVKKLGILKPTGSVSVRLRSDAIKFRVDDVLMFAGRQTGSMPSSTNLPNEPEFVKKYGVKIVVYHNSLLQKFNKELKPLLKHVDKFDVKRTKTSMSDANYRLIVLHEIAEGTVKYMGMEQRLGEYYDVVRELNADIFGVRSAKYHLLNGLITQEEYNELLVAFLIFAINVCHKANRDSSIMVYARGFYMIFNYLTKMKALTFKGGKMSVNFEKVSSYIDVFSDIILSMMSKGTVSDVEIMIKKWGDKGIVDSFPKSR